MLRLYRCIAEQHDLTLVVLAAVICALGSHATFELLRLARARETQWRRAWVALTAVSTGVAIWATHFVAMLAFQPGTPARYDVLGTIGSLLLPIGVSAYAFGAVISAVGWHRLAAGALVGLGASGMHYLGMSAFHVGGAILWDHGTVAVSVTLGILLPMLATWLATDADDPLVRLAAALLLVAGICALHFVGMSAVTVLPDPDAVPQADGLTPQVLAVAVGFGALLLLLLSLGAAALTRRARRRDQAEADRMRGLADATVEGLLVCDGPQIVAANRSLQELVGRDADWLVQRRVEEVVRLPADSAGAEGLAEAELLAAAGAPIPIELVRRPIVYRGRPHDVLAIRDLRARRAAEARIRFLSHHDPQTQLPNRAGFAEAFAREQSFRLRLGEGFALLALDLDHFKRVNDSFGHATGDALLAKVADRLRKAVRAGDLVSRVGGDEFAIVQFGAPQPEGATQLAARLTELLARPFIVQGQPLTIGVSIGIAVAPQDGTDQATLARNADLALYRAKADGRGCSRFFESAMDTRMQQRRLLEVELRAAVALGQFHLLYQPQLAVGPHEISGFEALVRWSHPQRGLIPPGDFIPLAEETGLIVPLGEWVLREACREAACWPRPASIAVNLSPLQFRAPGLVDLVRAACADAGLDPRRLELEVTESALLTDSAVTLDTLRQIKALGVRISMDDFGTGYSSLSYLRSFPFDKIKIDRSFVTDITAGGESAAIVRAIIGLGRSLNMLTTVEGVETHAQLAHVRAEGCDQVQGYLIGRPLPAAAAREMLGRRIAA